MAARSVTSSSTNFSSAGRACSMFLQLVAEGAEELLAGDDVLAGLDAER